MSEVYVMVNYVERNAFEKGESDFKEGMFKFVALNSAQAMKWAHENWGSCKPELRDNYHVEKVTEEGRELYMTYGDYLICKEKGDFINRLEV